MNRAKSLLFVTLCLLLCACQAGGGADVYQSKLGNFTCKVPPLIKPGRHITEKYYSDTSFVAFSDDFGTLVRIESCRLTDEQRAAIENPDHRRELLEKFFDSVIMQKEFLATSPQSTILFRDYVDTTAGKAAFTVVNIPGGSNLMTSVNGAYRRADSLRGVMIFTQRDFLYVVSDQEPVRTSQFSTPLPQQRSDARLKDLQSIVAGMTFR